MEDQERNIGQSMPINEETARGEDSTQGDALVNDHSSLSQESAAQDSDDNSSLDASQDSAEHALQDEAAPARDHSYLPGTSHPLFPETLLERRRRLRSSSFSRPSIEGTTKRSRSVSDELQTVTGVYDAPADPSWRGHREQKAPCHRVTSRFVELPILELNGVVLFPGSTIPIRLRSRDWIEYLGRQIDAARGIRGMMDAEEEVRLGIITYVDPRPARVQQQTQRRSWMRTAILPRRETGMTAFWREYDRLLRESVNDFEIDTDNDGDTPTESSGGSSTNESNGDSATVDGPQDPSDRRRRESASHQRNQRPLDPLVGRIGTMATITYTHEDAVGDVADAHQHDHTQYSRVWQRNDRSQLIITALGTGRFRIVRCIDGDDDDEFARRRHSGMEGDMATVRLYQVEELTDEELPLPPVGLRRRLTTDAKESEINVPFLIHQERTIRNMSQVSPVPYFVYHNAWPWQLVGLIREALNRIPGFEGLRKGLPSLPGSDEEIPSNESAPAASLLNPLRFSFWLSCNMPFSEREKLDLLEMHCTIKRLRFIYQKALEQKQHETYVCCKTCSRKLSRTASIFTVSGAEGTTGAYVNEHGIVHQTVTLRDLDEDHVFCSGGPETKDSWFPGYSWTITYCGFCHSHLGWKFLLVRTNEGSPENEQDRPDMFWGLSGASITTKTVSGNGY